MTRRTELDTILDACGHRHRRIVLAALTTHDQPLSFDDLTAVIRTHDHHAPTAATAAAPPNRIRTGLQHIHLPKLADAGLVTVDRHERAVAATSHPDHVEASLTTILSMDAELSPLLQSQTSTL